MVDFCKVSRWRAPAMKRTNILQPLTFFLTSKCRKDHDNQSPIANDVVDQLYAGEKSVVRFMIYAPKTRNHFRKAVLRA